MPFSANTSRIVCIASSLAIAGPCLAAEHCVQAAAARYGVDVRLVEAVLRVEGGRVGMRSPNANGSHDLGPMQINTAWLPQLRAQGVDESQLLWDYCANVAVGTWILARELKAASAPPNTPEYWQSVGRYHSRTPARNARYAVKVWYQAKKGGH